MQKRLKVVYKNISVDISSPQPALCYPIPSNIKKDVQDGKFVPLYKLLPGSEAKSSSVLSSNVDMDGSIKLSLGNFAKDKKLCRQPLEVQQLIMALLKYKYIISDNDPNMAHEYRTLYFQYYFVSK